ncbi:hypothetical protein V6N13_126165 [Hibiscus sabdariffa]
MSRVSSLAPDHDFIAYMFDAGLHDLGFQGPNFTWNRGYCAARLDRCLCNASWLEAHPATLVHDLLRLKSDHRPSLFLLVTLSLVILNVISVIFLAGFNMMILIVLFVTIGTPPFPSLIQLKHYALLLTIGIGLFLAPLLIGRIILW